MSIIEELVPEPLPDCRVVGHIIQGGECIYCHEVIEDEDDPLEYIQADKGDWEEHR